MGALFDMHAFYRLLEEGSSEQLRQISTNLQVYIETGGEVETVQEAKYFLRKVEAALLQRIVNPKAKQD